MTTVLEFRTKLRPKPDRRDGETYDHERDAPRLNPQAASVLDLMIDGKWRTLRQISKAIKQPEASVSARLRDLRKPRFGSWKVDRQHIANGLWQYRVLRGEP